MRTKTSPITVIFNTDPGSSHCAGSGMRVYPYCF